MGSLTQCPDPPGQSPLGGWTEQYFGSLLCQPLGVLFSKIHLFSLPRSSLGMHSSGQLSVQLVTAAGFSYFGSCHAVLVLPSPAARPCREAFQWCCRLSPAHSSLQHVECPGVSVEQHLVGFLAFLCIQPVLSPDPLSLSTRPSLSIVVVLALLLPQYGHRLLQASKSHPSSMLILPLEVFVGVLLCVPRHPHQFIC